MFPEIISNGVASLQQGSRRCSVIVDFTPAGQRTHVRFANAAIKVKRRFSYEQVRDIFAAADKKSAGRESKAPKRFSSWLLAASSA